MKLKLLFILIFFSFRISAQGTIKEKFDYEVIYKLSFKLDSTLVKPESEYMMLYMGKDYSYYISRAQNFEDEIKVKGNSGSTPQNALTNFHYQILKEIKSDRLFYVHQIASDRFYFGQDKNIFNWQIETETKEIKGYKVQKAITNFAGRDYVAWFTPDVPISDGPYKFNGLPGLILEISDVENEWNFEFFGLKKLSPKQDFKLKFNQLIKTSLAELKATNLRYRKDPFTYINNPNITISPEVHQKYIESFAEMLEKEN
ncbi:MAG: GLPGLI family protein, partial [Flavobacteriaceae bacterium]|nr:GLPGLI family protein [Flavobacteriaceae bacterium]